MSENEKKQTPAAAAADDENHIIAERRAKLAKLREEGVAYPNDFVRKDLSAICAPNTAKKRVKSSMKPLSKWPFQAA